MLKVSNCASVSRLRISSPLRTKGPKRPLATTTSTPSSASPTVRGNESSCSACSSWTEAGSMSLNSELRLGLGAFFSVGSSPSCT